MTKELAAEIKVSLVIYGFECSPHEISRLLEAEPTRTVTRGEPIPKTILKRNTNRWILDSGAAADAPLSVHFEALLKRAPNTKKFATLPAETSVQISCAIYDRNRSVPLVFPSNVVQYAADIGADISLDYYDLGSD
jgi:hypothetical protein